MTDHFQLCFDQFSWIEEQSETDLCAHGSVKIAVGDGLLIQQDGLCLTASALNLLRTLRGNFDSHPEAGENRDLLIPHCGHVWYPTEAGVYIMPGCPIGITWSIQHEGEMVNFSQFHNAETTSGISSISSLFTARVSLDTYRQQVLAVSEAVIHFHDSQPPRSFHDDEAKAGHRAFWHEFNQLRQQTF